MRTKQIALYFRRNIEFYVVSIAFLTVLTLFYYEHISQPILLGLLGTIATLFFGSLKYKIENDKLFKELFLEFNNRYDMRFNDLINTLKYDQDKDLTNDDQNLIIDYFNLCAEEYLWRSKNRIPKNVWVAWKSGIKENLEIKQVRDLFAKETSTINGKKSFYGLAEELNFKQ